MAKAGKQDSEQKMGTKSPSLLSAILSVFLATLLAGGAGFGFGSFVLNGAGKPDEAAAPHGASGRQEKTEDKGQSHDPAGPAEHGASDSNASQAEEAKPPPEAVVRQLAPIITNLREPKNSWIRLELAIVIRKEAAHDQDLIAVRSADKVVGVLHNTGLSQIDGPSGLLYLRQDIRDALITSKEDPVVEVLIASMVVE